MKVKVIEALCGCGKSYAMINNMRKQPNECYLWVTPFLDEAGDDDSDNVGRVRTQAPELSFQTPTSKHRQRKLGDLGRLLELGENVSLTHNLFLNITESMLMNIKRHNYIIIIDESIDKVDIHSKSSDKIDDVKGLIASGIIEVKNKGQLDWTGLKLNAFIEEYELCKRGMLYWHNNRLLIKRYSSQIYEAAKQVYVLTYMFEASTMRVWFDANDIEWQYEDIELRTTTSQRKSIIRDLITIEPTPSFVKEINNQSNSSFSSNWFNGDKFDKVSNLIQKHATALYLKWYKMNSISPDIMFTVFKAHIDKVSGKGCKRMNYLESESSFVAKNSRATNNHANKNFLIYWVNVYPQIDVMQYLNGLVGKDKAMSVDQYALSEMIQWIFRSALREEQPIRIFIASDRMRELLIDWLNNDQ